MPGHVLRELHHFLERNKNTQNKKAEKKRHRSKTKKLLPFCSFAEGGEGVDMFVSRFGVLGLGIEGLKVIGFRACARRVSDYAGIYKKRI